MHRDISNISTDMETESWAKTSKLFSKTKFVECTVSKKYLKIEKYILRDNFITVKIKFLSQIKNLKIIHGNYG